LWDMLSKMPLDRMGLPERLHTLAQVYGVAEFLGLRPSA
jgi:hypothetical protein